MPDDQPFPPKYPGPDGDVTIHNWMVRLVPDLDKQIEIFKARVTEEYGPTSFTLENLNSSRQLSWRPATGRDRWFGRA